MPAESGFQEERAELEAVLRSGIFDHAPNMARFLNYVCLKYFEGQQEQIKEYNVAVQALGRPPDFDPEQDSIVRVEAHRLRKRLNAFYERGGSTHKLRIVLPIGQYIPQFVVNQMAAGGLGESAGVPASSGVTAQTHPLVSWRRIPLAGLALAACGLGTWLTVRPRSTQFLAAPAPAVPQGEETRILVGCAEGPYTDRFGHVWQADRYYAGGYATNYAGHAVKGARDARIYQTAREGEFQYDIPLAPGSYELRLYFAEMLFGEGNVGGGGEGSRTFNVDANGKRLLSNFDVIADAAGANIANERVFKDISPAADGRLHLRFTHLVRDPFLNAIEITPGTPGRLRPIRILTADSPYLDPAGNFWEADHYYHGGQLIPRPNPVSGGSDPSLYRSQRCGNITYVIPVAPGTYSMRLRFAEGWYGTGKPVPGGVGSRRFNIFCNSVALARNFDIYREAGGAQRGLERTFHGLTPSPQGKLVLYLQPIEGYACVNAIEIWDSGR